MFFNVFVLFCIVVGIVVVSVCEEGLIMVILVVLSMMIKGWMDFRKLLVKMDVCCFVYIIFDKLFIEIVIYLWGMSFDDVENFFVKC